MAGSVIFPNNASVLDHIVACTAQIFADQRGRGFATAPPPGREQIQDLLTLAFAGSLEQEEGRTVVFTLFYDETVQYIDYAFKEPLRLTPGTLARLSAALNPSQTYICVTLAGSKLAMAGFRHWGDHSSFRSYGGGPSHFSIRVTGPGVLVVRYDLRLVLTYRRGEVVFHPVGSNWLGEARRALCWSVTPSGDELSDVRVLESVVHIAACMWRLGHGGTLLILPDGQNWEGRATSCTFAPAQPSSRVCDAVAAHVAHERLDQDARNRLYDEHLRAQIDAQTASGIASVLGNWRANVRLGVELEWLAHLTATDGMTVIRPDLTLLGFGVFFRMDVPAGGLRIRTIDPFAAAATEAVSSDLSMVGGARHRSAATTCSRFPGATAIVASQDGELSAMRWDTDNQVVLRHRHLELLFHL